jgi:amidohydrolase
VTGGAVEALRAAIDRELPAAVELRHRIHAAPQRSGEEGPTRDLVLAALPARHGVIRTAGTGAIVRVGGPGPAVGVRAELDALELDELTSVPWRSTNPGVMHACGHDVHLAALVALSRALDTVGGPVPLLAILQPREETYPSGALDIVEEGWLEQEHCFSTIGAHVQPHLPAGEVACTPGVVNASSDEFSIEVEGVGGHAAYPHLTRDPVLTLSDIVVSLQALVSRRADPMEPVVLSVTTLTAGTAANIVPGAATARGTVRAMEPAGRESLLNQMAEVVDFVARSHGCTAKLTVVSGEPHENG